MIKLNRGSCPNPSELSTNYKYPSNKNSLLEVSFHKCMYCESKITDISFGDVEHIKPKSKYPELEFDRANLGIVCSKCNNNKLDKYREDIPFINPYEDNPKNHFIFLSNWISPKNGNNRGELTIDTIKLNRKELIEQRGSVIQKIDSIISRFFNESNPTMKKIIRSSLVEFSQEENEYSSYIESLLRAHKIIN